MRLVVIAMVALFSLSTLSDAVLHGAETGRKSKNKEEVQMVSEQADQTASKAVIETANEIVSKTVIKSDSLGDLSQSDSVEVVKRGLFRKIGDYFKNSNEDKTTFKKFDFSIIGGPHYSSSVKLGLGLVAAGQFRLNQEDTITPPSNVSIVSDVSTSGFWMLGVRGNTFFKDANHRIDYSAFFYSMPTKLWGIGYDMGRHSPNETEYSRSEVSLKIDYMYRLYGKLYVGANGLFSSAQGKKFDSWFSDDYYIDGQSRKHINTGVGFFVLYDSRDYVTAPQKGWYFKLENVFFPKFLGNKLHFNRTELTLNYYHKVWKGGLLAYDLHSEYNSGDVPWTQLAQMGNGIRMRGYYEGRYRDNGIIEVQAELRQNVWRRIGVAIWGGAGNVFSKPSQFKFSHTLPNYGVGLRWEFKNRVNVRFDFGMGKGQSGFIFNINEAF